MKISTNRKFKIKPRNNLFYISDPNCEHRKWRSGGACWLCLGCLGDEERIGHDAEFETDGLTYSKVSLVYLELNNGERLKCEASNFEIIEEVK